MIDPSAVDRLVELGGEELLTAVRSAFEDASKEKIELIRSAELATAKAAAHHLKSSAWNMGANELAQSCDALERYRGPSTDVHVDRLRQDILDGYDTAVGALETLLSGREVGQL